MKRFVLFIFALFITFSTYGQNSFYEGSGGKNHKIMFADSTLENGLYDKSDLWVTDKIKTNLIAVLQRYGGFNCLDLSEAKNILKVQKQLESGIYDDSQSIEIGRLVKAKECVNIKTTRFPSGSYSVSIMFFDVESGQILGTFTSPKTYDSAESYSMLAPYDCAPDILRHFEIVFSKKGQQAFLNEKTLAVEQVEKNKVFAKENAKIEEERSEKARAEAERRAKIENEEREKKEAKEKAEAEAAAKALAEKKRLEREARERAKRQNPFATETYSCEFDNGSRHDSYSVRFTSQNECTVTVTSTDSKGVVKTVSKNGNYSYNNEILCINVFMPNSDVKHVQKINWKGQVSFKNGYKSFLYMIPVSSIDNAKKIRVEFYQK